MPMLDRKDSQKVWHTKSMLTWYAGVSSGMIWTRPEETKSQKVTKVTKGGEKETKS